MKKILSFVLVLAMIASMMCISVSAVNVVGTHGDNKDTADSIKDGVDANDSDAWKTHSTNITANVSTTATPKYAIELTYSHASISVVNSATWNVNTLMYEGDTTITVETTEATTTKTFKSSDANTEEIADIATFAVTNYSSGAITVSTKLTNQLGGVTLKIVNDETKVDIANAREGIDAVKAENGKSGEAVTEKYTASMDSDDWAAAFATVNTTDFVIASITFSFAAN